MNKHTYKLEFVGVKWKSFLFVFISAFFLNLIWENAHACLYINYRGGDITQFILIRAALFDALFITALALLFLGVAFLKKRLWLAFAIGVVFAVLLELYALKTGRWAYNDFMPIVPFLNVGLSPMFQLGILSFIIFKLANKN